MSYGKPVNDRTLTDINRANAEFHGTQDKASQDISHEGGRQITKRKGAVVVQHDEGDAVTVVPGTKKKVPGGISQSPTTTTRTGVHAIGHRIKKLLTGRDAFPATDKTLAQVNDANQQYYNNSLHAGNAQDCGDAEKLGAQVMKPLSQKRKESRENSQRQQAAWKKEQGEVFARHAAGGRNAPTKK